MGTGVRGEARQYYVGRYGGPTLAIPLCHICYALGLSPWPLQKKLWCQSPTALDWTCVTCGTQWTLDKTRTNQSQPCLREVYGWAWEAPGPYESKANPGKDLYHGLNPIITHESPAHINTI